MYHSGLTAAIVPSSRAAGSITYRTARQRARGDSAASSVSRLPAARATGETSAPRSRLFPTSDRQLPADRSSVSAEHCVGVLTGKASVVGVIEVVHWRAGGGAITIRGTPNIGVRSVAGVRGRCQFPHCSAAAPPFNLRSQLAGQPHERPARQAEIGQQRAAPTVSSVRRAPAWKRDASLPDNGKLSVDICRRAIWRYQPVESGCVR